MQLIVNELLSRGVVCHQIPNTCIIEASSSVRCHYLSQYTLPIIPQLYTQLLDNKKNFKALLRHYHIPFILPSQVFEPHQVQDALHYVQHIIGFPVLCKPQFGMSMQNVSLNILDAEEFLMIWEQRYYASLSAIIVERYIPNTSDYRFVCFKDYEPAVLARHDPYLVGDGIHSITQLVANENQLRRIFAKLSALIIEDDQAKHTLEHQQLSVDSIPARGQIVKLSYGADVNRGGVYEVIDNDLIHADYWNLVQQIWDIFPKMPYFSVDILATNLHDKPSIDHTAINESHVGACVQLFLDPVKGHGVNLFSRFVDLLFPETMLIS